MKITNEKINEVYETLNAEGFYTDGIYTDSNLPDCILCIDINWGDWKHEHARLKWLMDEKFDTTYFGNKVTEEDGSDCYSATHYFAFN